MDSTTLEANAAMKSIVRRDTGESYTGYLKRLARAEGVDATDAAALRRMDRKRPKKMANDVLERPSDPEAQITRLKDGRTALAFKIENGVDMETGAQKVHASDLDVASVARAAANFARLGFRVY